MIIVGGRSAASRTPPHDAINWPSPAKTMASGGAGGTYAVTCRPLSYSKVSVRTWPAMGDIGARGLLVSGGSGRASRVCRDLTVYRLTGGLRLFARQPNAAQLDPARTRRRTTVWRRAPDHAPRSRSIDADLKRSEGTRL